MRVRVLALLNRGRFGLRGAIVRTIYRVALTLLLVAPVCAPAFAAEPDAPVTLIGRTESIRIAVQNRLSAKFTATTEAKKS